MSKILISFSFSFSISVLPARLCCFGLPTASPVGFLYAVDEPYSFSLFFLFFPYDWCHGTQKTSCRYTSSLLKRWCIAVARFSICRRYAPAGHPKSILKRFSFLLCLALWSTNDMGSSRASVPLAYVFVCRTWLDWMLTLPRDFLVLPVRRVFASRFHFFLLISLLGDILFRPPVYILVYSQLWSSLLQTCVPQAEEVAFKTVAPGYPRLSKCRIHTPTSYWMLQ